MEFVRTRIEAAVLGITMPGQTIDYLNPPGDPGLFGPQSMAWQVHGDFTAMLAGGVSALMLQMLHPAALAGVWDHSNFRVDMLGRLRRTARFVAATTYASRQDADYLIDHVRRIHASVSGLTPAGTPYAASDPHLLTWVHVAEVSSFLESFLVYRQPDFPLAAQNQYLDEIALIAERLGAQNVPRNVVDMRNYLESMRGELVNDARTQETLRLVLTAPAPGPLAVPFVRLMMRAGIDLLPGFAQDMLGVRQLGSVRQAALRQSVRLAAQPLRWAVRNGTVHRAKRRVGVP
ncbi:histidine kinase [Pigmentiphaga litoralis]|uniref:oxygenase MpaB family protein n=1 Tax=Pigmentiphaga litoralis TaxID=516702 RepID=UPI001673E3E2|nr:oxygenase MpaB family protein [Pigmentiphaga litoralis]GGX21784.1 histidine kinase [Pigmentiphaga litoralis]